MIHKKRCKVNAKKEQKRRCYDEKGVKKEPEMVRIIAIDGIFSSEKTPRGCRAPYSRNNSRE